MTTNYSELAKLFLTTPMYRVGIVMGLFTEAFREKIVEAIFDEYHRQCL